MKLRANFRIRALMVTIATVLSVISIFAISMPAFAGNPDNTNDPAYWTAAGYGTCAKDDPTTTPFILPAAPAGNHWTLLVIKAGSGDNENTLYTNPVPGPYVHSTGKNISHAIYCYKADPVVTTTTTTTTTVPPTTTSTTTTTVPPTTTTTTTVPPTTTTTTTVPPTTTTTTTVPPTTTSTTTTSTTAPETTTTTTEPETTTTTTAPETTTTAPETTTAPPVTVLGTVVTRPATTVIPAPVTVAGISASNLPVTGSDDYTITFGALMLLVGGIVAVRASKRRRVLG